MGAAALVIALCYRCAVSARTAETVVIENTEWSW